MWLVLHQHKKHHLKEEHASSKVDPGFGEKIGTMAGKFTTKVGKAVDNVAGKIYFGWLMPILTTAQ